MHFDASQQYSCILEYVDCILFIYLFIFTFYLKCLQSVTFLVFSLLTLHCIWMEGNVGV